MFFILLVRCVMYVDVSPIFCIKILLRVEGYIWVSESL